MKPFHNAGTGSSPAFARCPFFPRNRGFTLLELSIVLIIIALVTSMAVTSGISVVANARLTSTKNKMAAIDQALMAFRVANNRLPCPTDLTITSSNASYGIEAANPGTCTGGTPAANFTSGAVCGTPEGGLPAVTLGLPADFIYDGWGNRFRYAVDPNATAAGAFTSMAATYSGPITVNDANGNARSTKSIYAVVSHGPNGHGAYTASGVTVNAGSDNTNELINCHCSSSGVNTGYPAASYGGPTYVQQSLYNNPSDSRNTFDDLVSFRERWQMMTPWDSASGSFSSSTSNMAASAGSVQAFGGACWYDSTTFQGCLTMPTPMNMAAITLNTATNIFNYLPTTNISPNPFPGATTLWCLPSTYPEDWSWDDLYVVSGTAHICGALETIIFQRSRAILSQVATISYASHTSGTYPYGAAWSNTSPPYLLITYTDSTMDLYQVTESTNTFTPILTDSLIISVWGPPTWTMDGQYAIGYCCNPSSTILKNSSGTFTSVPASTVISDSNTGTFMSSFTGIIDFSRDGNYAVLLQDASHIKVYHNSGGDLFVPYLTLPYTTAAAANYDIGSPKWSPNGNYFAFGVVGTTEIHIFKKCGSNFIEIPGGAHLPSGSTAGSSTAGNSISWSADSQYLSAVDVNSTGYSYVDIFQTPNFTPLAQPPFASGFTAAGDSAWAFRRTNNP